MNFCETNPFVRHAQYLQIKEAMQFFETVALDCRIFYVTRGTGQIQVCGKDFVLETGSMLFINSGVPYKIISTDTLYLQANFDFTQNNSHREVAIPPVRVDLAEEIIPLETVSFDDFPYFQNHIFLSSAYSNRTLMEEAIKEYTRKFPYFREKASSLIKTVLYDILRKVETEGRNHDRFNYEQIAEYIRQHYGEEIDNKRLAKQFNLHPNYISSEFKRCMGIPLHKYLLQVRIYKAISFFEEGNLSVTDVAEKVGFPDYNYFSRYFKQITGMSPSAFLSKKSIGKD